MPPHCRRALPVALLAALLSAYTAAAQPAFRLAPAVAAEAEDFRVESGWKVVRNGHGNYMVDMVGFNHISGERLLSLGAAEEKGSARLDVTVPEAGPYRLWVRYEYPTFCETRFRVVIEQDGRAVLDHVMGKKDSPRFGFGEPFPRAPHDPSWGSEGLLAEAVSVASLWSALQPPHVPDRGPNTHSVPTAFDKGARELLRLVLRAAAVEPTVTAEPPLLDTRLLEAPHGCVLPLAKYHPKVGQKVMLTVRTSAAVRKVTSAYHGELPFKQEKGRLVVMLPALGYGDVLRLDTDNK